MAEPQLSGANVHKLALGEVFFGAGGGLSGATVMLNMGAEPAPMLFTGVVVGGIGGFVAMEALRSAYQSEDGEDSEVRA